MASSYSSLFIELQVTGENDTTWGDIANVNFGTTIEEALAETTSVTFASAEYTLTTPSTNATSPARHLRLDLGGTSGGAQNLIVPTWEKSYIVNNGTADAITVKTSAGTGIAVPTGKTMWLYADGTNVVDVTTHLTSLTLGSALPVASGGTNATSASITAFNNITGYTASGATGTTSTNLVFSTSPTLITPTLGVASATTVNKVTLTTPATGSTLTIADGKTLTVSKTMQFTAADDTGVYTLPTGTATLIDNSVATLSSLTSIGTIGTGVWQGSAISPTYITTGTSGTNIPLLDGANTWSGLQTLSVGADNTPAATPSTTAVGYLGIPQLPKDAVYTLEMTDAGKHIYHNEVTARAWTIPPNSSVAFPIGTAIAMVNKGAGTVTITRGSGVALWAAGDGTDENKSLTQYGYVVITKIATDEWVMTGQL